MPYGGSDVLACCYDVLSQVFDEYLVVCGRLQPAVTASPLGHVPPRRLLLLHAVKLRQGRCAADCSHSAQQHADAVVAWLHPRWLRVMMAAHTAWLLLHPRVCWVLAIEQHCPAHL